MLDLQRIYLLFSLLSPNKKSPFVIKNQWSNLVQAYANPECKARVYAQTSALKVFEDHKLNFDKIRVKLFQNLLQFIFQNRSFGTLPVALSLYRDLHTQLLQLSKQFEVRGRAVQRSKRQGNFRLSNLILFE